MAGQLITGDWEIEYNGLRVGGDEAFSQMEIDGLLDLPAIRTSDRARLRRDGLQPAEDFAGGKTITLTMELHGETPALFTSRIREFLAAFAPSRTERELVMRIPGYQVDRDDPRIVVFARPRRRDWPIERDYYYRTPILAVELAASDPRVYGFNRRSGSTPVRTPAVGIIPPLTPPVALGAAGTGGTVLLDNSGAYETPWVARVDGPVTGPRIEHGNLGLVLDLDIDLADGQWLILDSDSRRVLFNGTSPRRVLRAGSRWFHLQPGVNPIEFTSGSQAVQTGTLTGTYRSASI